MKYRRILSSAQSAPNPTVQQLTTVNGSPTGGTFTLFVTGNSSTFAYNATAATIQTAIQAWGGSYVGVTVTGSAGGPYTLTYPIAGTPLVDATSALTGGTSPSVSLSPDPTPPVSDAPPPFPAPSVTNEDTNWKPQWARNFIGAPTFNEGQFTAPANGYAFDATTNPALANDWLTGKFTWYTFAKKYYDSRLQKGTALQDMVSHAGQNYIDSPTNSFNPATQIYGYIWSPTPTGGTTAPFADPTRVLASPAPTTSRLYLSNIATSSVTFKGRIRYDGGRYDERAYSIPDSVHGLQLRVHSDVDTDPDANGPDSANMIHHVGAFSPALGGWNGGAVRTDSGLTGKGYSGRAVLGGEFVFCIQVPRGLPTYKFAYLLYPYNNNANPEYNGEFDIAEAGLDNVDKTISFFMHTWDHAPPGGTANRTGQRGGQTKLLKPGGNPATAADYTITLKPIGGSWNTWRFQWRPNQVDHTLSTAKLYINDTLTNWQWGPGTINPTSGSIIPWLPMNWTMQTEVEYSNFAEQIDNTVNEVIRYAWCYYRAAKGLVTT